MKKKVLFISHSSNSTGGAEDDFERIISYFAKLPEYEIHILSPAGKRFESFSAYSERSGSYQQGWFPVLRSSLLSYLKYFLIGMKQIWDIRKFMKDTTYDYSIINVSVLFFPALYVHLSKIKSIIFIRETITPLNIRSRYYKFLRKLSKHFIGVSNFNSDDFRKLTGCNNTSVLYSSIESKKDQLVANEEEFGDSIDANIVSELNDPTSFKLLLNGNICERKNQILALKTLNHLVNVLGLSELKLFLVGNTESDRSYYEMLLDYLESYKLVNNCFFLGAQRKPVVYKLYDKIDLSLITSLSEGLPLVLVESFSFRKPVISTDVGGIGEIIKNGVNGYLIESFDELEIAKRVVELKNNKFLYDILSENSYESFLSNFNLESNMQELERILISL